MDKKLLALQLIQTRPRKKSNLKRNLLIGLGFLIIGLVIYSNKETILGFINNLRGVF